MARLSKKFKARMALIISALFLIIASLLCAYVLYCIRAQITPPSPNVSEQNNEVLISNSSDNSSEFPSVDWTYWQNINNDVIGWITIPGTNINSPILQAHQNDPDYYLHHDVYKHVNPAGAIYLDADCEDQGLSSRNAVILGHHFQGNPSIAPMGNIVNYIDKSFASTHSKILIQTPNSKMMYEARFAQIINGSKQVKRTSFANEDDFHYWYKESRDSATMILDKNTEPEQTISLVTCSYNIWVKNERTILVTSMQK